MKLLSRECRKVGAFKFRGATNAVRKYPTPHPPSPKPRTPSRTPSLTLKTTHSLTHSLSHTLTHTLAHTHTHSLTRETHEWMVHRILAAPSSLPETTGLRSGPHPGVFSTVSTYGLTTVGTLRQAIRRETFVNPYRGTSLTRNSPPP